MGNSNNSDLAEAETLGWEIQTGAKGKPTPVTPAPSPAVAPVQAVKKPLPDFNAIPAALQARDQWVLWKLDHRSGKPTKVPYYATVTDDGLQLKKASTTNPATWSTFEKIQDDFEIYFSKDMISGIGFVFKEGDGLVGIDVDHQRDPITGLWETGILEKILSFNSYAEFSQSGTGAHVIVMGDKPGKKCRSGDLEIYDAGRFFVMTGRHIPETPSNVKEATAGALEALYREIAPDSIHHTVQPLERSSALPLHLEDAEVIRRAESALNGPKFTALFRADNLTEYGGDHSAADLALCNLISFWSRDKNQIDRIFRGSALFRPKWDEQRGQETYGEKTIGEALISSTRTRRTPTTEQEETKFTLWGTESGAITARVLPDRAGVYRVEFLKAGKSVHTETTRSPMWESPKLQDNAGSRLATALNDETISPDFVRKKIREAFAVFAERITTNKQVQQALASEPVRRVMKMTEKVEVFPSAATTYEITISGMSLTVPVREMARTDPSFVNTAWLNLFPTKPLDATRNDWLQIREHWMNDDLAVIRETETLTEAEIVIDQLQAELESVSLVEPPELVNDESKAWMDPDTKEVWVPARRITRFLDEIAKKPGWSSRLSKEIRAAGWMKSATRTKKMGNPPRETRCWVFVDGFATFRDTRDAPADVSEYLKNTGGGNR
jgi:putative DNA primase/helicase